MVESAVMEGLGSTNRIFGRRPEAQGYPTAFSSWVDDTDKPEEPDDEDEWEDIPEDLKDVWENIEALEKLAELPQNAVSLSQKSAQGPDDGGNLSLDTFDTGKARAAPLVDDVFLAETRKQLQGFAKIYEEETRRVQDNAAAQDKENRQKAIEAVKKGTLRRCSEDIKQAKERDLQIAMENTQQVSRAVSRGRQIDRTEAGSSKRDERSTESKDPVTSFIEVMNEKRRKSQEEDFKQAIEDSKKSARSSSGEMRKKREEDMRKAIADTAKALEGGNFRRRPSL